MSFDLDDWRELTLLFWIHVGPIIPSFFYSFLFEISDIYYMFALLLYIAHRKGYEDLEGI